MPFKNKRKAKRLEAENRNRVNQLKQRIRSDEYGTTPQAFTRGYIKRKKAGRVFGLDLSNEHLILRVDGRYVIKMPQSQWEKTRGSLPEGTTYDRRLKALILPRNYEL